MHLLMVCVGESLQGLHESLASLHVRAGVVSQVGSVAQLGHSFVIHDV